MINFTIILLFKSLRKVVPPQEERRELYTGRRNKVKRKYNYQYYSLISHLAQDPNKLIDIK